ncbi:MAG TPA: 2Fe-2S iron-sulfur cluster-binding protein [Cyclobacteriaceae bacterium]|nr:2Fe-2S iron-sulfur cluster-binding protein [Cyclobacteriaceae bacterium]
MTRRAEYRNLMALLYDKLYIDGFGECKGTGRCGTCHIHIINDTNDPLQRVGNEATTLAKMDSASPNSRLACQMMIDKSLDGLQIEVISN